ncbi:MAG TPA: hypothetical protein VL017_06015 [Devosia sp.]|nr:hypothetical protein [Devosia sp.]
MAGRWRETSPTELAGWLAHVTVPWAFAGGWALDLWAGIVSRPHSDIEISCLRADLAAVTKALPGFEIVVAQNKHLSPWRPDAPPRPPFSLWLRRDGETLWDFEIVSEAHDGDSWRYRRDERVALPLDGAYRRIVDGWRVIAPEVQLLYKCRELRDKDIADLQRFWPLLDRGARQWLRTAVAMVHPQAMATLDAIDRAPPP